MYCLNMWAIVNKLKLNLVDATVEEIFQAYHGRVFRVLKMKGFLDEKKVSFIYTPSSLGFRWSISRTLELF